VLHQTRRAFSLVEVLLAAVILALVGIPVLSVFISSTHTVSRTDTRREIRYYIMEILAHVQRQALHELWRNFGPGDVVGYQNAGLMKDRLALVDPSTHKVLPYNGSGDNPNPLGFTDEFLQDMDRDGYDARLHFEFYTRKELGLPPIHFAPGKDPPKDPPGPLGMLHMQAGYVSIKIIDLRTLKDVNGDESKAVAGEWGQPIMCPAIVGRPGLQLKSCPAVAPDVRRKFGPLLEIREAAL